MKNFIMLHKRFLINGMILYNHDKMIDRFKEQLAIGELNKEKGKAEKEEQKQMRDRKKELRSEIKLLEEQLNALGMKKSEIKKLKESVKDEVSE